MGAKVKEISDGIDGLLELNRVKATELTLGEEKLELREITINGTVYQVLAKAEASE